MSLKRGSLRTYDEWQSRGMQVLRGQKAYTFNKDGEALFERSQVDYKEDPPMDYKDPPWEDDGWGMFAPCDGIV